jgi:hypothetical protein
MMAQLTGTVSTASGQPLRGVRVQVGWWSTTTNRHGYYLLRWLTAGVKTVVFSKTGYQEVKMPQTTTAGQTTTDNVTMVLLPTTGTLAGKVTDSVTGAGIPGVSIAGQQVGGSNTFTGTTASDGTYSIPNIPAGSYSVAFSKAGYNPITQ